MQSELCSVHNPNFVYVPFDSWSFTCKIAVKGSRCVLSFCFCFFTLRRYNKSVPQLLIRWSVQKNYITIPKSSKPERIQENADVFDFSITDDDMKTLVRSSL